jgi:hypothetical protein
VQLDGHILTLRRDAKGAMWLNARSA